MKLTWMFAGTGLLWAAEDISGCLASLCRSVSSEYIQVM